MSGRRSPAATLLAAALLACSAAAARASLLTAAGPAVDGTACTWLPHAVATPGEGLADPASALASTERPLRVAMLFVTPRGITPSESPDRLFASLAPQVQRWFAVASYGRVRLELDDLPLWLPVGAPTVPAAESAAWQLTDLAGVDAVVAVLPAETRASSSHAEVVQSARVRFGVVLAPHPTADAARAPDLWKILAHELGHLVGLPDLYGTAGFGAAGVYAGPWDPMSMPLGQNVLAWHAYQLGWIDGTAVHCLAGGATEQELTPAGADGGVKAVVAPLGSGAALVVEARRRAGLDAGLCAEGVLVYDVETDAVPGAPPVRVETRDDSAGACGPLSDATLQPGGSIEDAGVRVQVLAADAAGYRVRVTRLR